MKSKNLISSPKFPHYARQPPESRIPLGSFPGKSVDLYLNLKLKKKQMQYLLIAYDGTDPGALDRRLGVREGHLSRIGILKNAGEFLFGGAILDEKGTMIGSMIVYEYPDRDSLNRQLKTEPYITEGVWVKIDIQPLRLANIV
jgi:uncharacterized protein YciI